MIIMKMGHKKMECLIRQTIRHNFVTKNPQSGPSIKNEPIVGTGVHPYARSIASEGGSLVKRQNFCNKFPNLRFRTEVLTSCTKKSRHDFLAYFRGVGGCWNRSSSSFKMNIHSQREVFFS